jgi:hypothetical protein
MLLVGFINPGARILEIGAGPGRFTIELARLGATGGRARQGARHTRRGNTHPLCRAEGAGEASRNVMPQLTDMLDAHSSSEAGRQVYVPGDLYQGTTAVDHRTPGFRRPRPRTGSFRKRPCIGLL